MSNYYVYMGKHLDLNNERIKEVVDLIGSKSSLNEGLDIAKALIENYFESDKNAEEIIKLINEKKDLLK